MQCSRACASEMQPTYTLNALGTAPCSYQLRTWRTQTNQASRPAALAGVIAACHSATRQAMHADQRRDSVRHAGIQEVVVPHAFLGIVCFECAVGALHDLNMLQQIPLLCLGKSTFVRATLLEASRRGLQIVFRAVPPPLLQTRYFFSEM